MIKLVITDLDNTIYNWVDYYVPSFNAMVAELVRLTGLDEHALRQSFKRVHQKRGTSEYSFSIEELDVLADVNRGLSSREVLQKYGSAIRAFRETRSRTLRLYDGVRETLQILRGQGKKIAAHTDAMMFYALYRLKQLEVDQLFDAIAAPRDHGIPESIDPGVARTGDARRYESAVPIKDELEPNMLKPDPAILRRILNDCRVDPWEAVYVGDSLPKDIRMAQECGVHDVYAQYGRNYRPEHYRELVEITHWTEEDVARELDLNSLNVRPMFTISRFPDLLAVVEQLDATARPSSRAPSNGAARSQPGRQP